MIAVYTAILAEYDNLRPPAVHNPGCRYVCFSDRPRRVAPWETQGFPMLFDDPATNARIPKMLPHLLLPEAEFSIYHDGAFRMKVDPHQAVALLGNADLAMFAHPTNKSIFDERDFYQRQHGFVPDHVAEHVGRYEAEELPITGEFWAGGFVVRRHCPTVERFNELWMREYLDGSPNDQFGLYGAVVKSGVRVATIAGHVIMDARFGYHLHANSGCGDNPGYEAENAAWSARVARIREVCA